MIEHLNEEQLNGVVDGTLAGAARDAAERHLATCAACRQEVAAMQALVAGARGLPRTIEPAGDLWPGIAPRLRRPAVPAWLAAAAVLVLAATGVLLWAGRSKAGDGWEIASAEGRPSIASGVLRPGQELRTDQSSHVRLRVGTLGTVRVAPQSRVRLLASRPDEQRLALDHGTIEARIVAPARVFLVETPAALAVDLGCAYTLTTDSTGNGHLHVTSGWVELRNGDRVTVVPRDAYATIRSKLGPGTARAPDASPELVRALDAYDFEQGGVAAVRAVLAAVRKPTDGVTLLNLLSSAPDSLRAAIYDRLVAIAGGPEGVSRDSALGLDRTTINRWWDFLVPPRLERESDDPKARVRPAASELAVERVVTGLRMPLHLTAPAGDARLFVVEQDGRIRIVKNGALVRRPFLDITKRVGSGGERGLLSLAFHPRYAETGWFFVYYTDRAGDIQIERYKVSADPDVADTTSAFPILKVAHPTYSNHNGGHVLFGLDGMLYIGTGDGGGGGDPSGHGQSRTTLLGKLLRIDVNGAQPYAVPPDNPYRDSSELKPEIWAYGLRNPWRMAFDRASDLLYIADVGQNQWEEVNVQPANEAGLNYGWNRMEGLHCYGLPVCRKTGLVLPALEYDHEDGCSITGGVVYRGKRIAFLNGHYLYSDYCTGFLRSFKFADGFVSERHNWLVGSLGSVLSFGEDAAGDVYVLSSNGSVYRLIEKR